MIQAYVGDIAAQMGIVLSKITVVDGRDVGCLSVHLLHISSSGRQVSALVHQSELDDLFLYTVCDRLEVKIRSALSRLETMTSDDHSQN